MKKSDSKLKKAAINTMLGAAVASSTITGSGLVREYIRYDSDLKSNPEYVMGQKEAEVSRNITEAKSSLEKRTEHDPDLYYMSTDKDFTNLYVIPGESHEIKPNPQEAVKNINKAIKLWDWNVNKDREMYNALVKARDSLSSPYSMKKDAESRDYTHEQSTLESTYKSLNQSANVHRQNAYDHAEQKNHAGSWTGGFLASLTGLASLFHFKDKKRNLEQKAVAVITLFSFASALVFLSPSILGNVISPSPSSALLNTASLSFFIVAIIGTIIYTVSVRNSPSQTF